jgi:hypothetical protein
MTFFSAGFTVDGFARSWDPHMWTAWGAPRWLACVLCCGGLAITTDWGQNERTLNKLLVDSGVVAAPVAG